MKKITLIMVVAFAQLFSYTASAQCYSRYGTPSNGVEYSSSVNGICAFCDISNAGYAADMDASNYASITVPVAVVGNVSLKLKLTATMSAGSTAGFMIQRGAGLVDASILSSITIKTYLGGTLRESKTGSNLAFLTLLGGVKQSIHFTSTLSFDHVEICVGGVIGALNNTFVYYAYGNNVALPVNWAYVRAQQSEEKNVQLSWGTTMEENSNYFNIEKSADGREWHYIGRVKAAGTTNEAQNYLFTDRFPSVSTAFYRIVEHDLSGAQQISDIVKVNGFTDIAVIKEMRIYPNPASSEISISYPAKAYYACIMDIQGRNIASYLPVSEKIDLSGFLPGYYQVILTDAIGHKLESTSLIISR